MMANLVLNKAGRMAGRVEVLEHGYQEGAFGLCVERPFSSYQISYLFYPRCLQGWCLSRSLVSTRTTWSCSAINDHTIC